MGIEKNSIEKSFPQSAPIKTGFFGGIENIFKQVGY